MDEKEEYEMINLVSYEEMNVQSLMFRWESNFRCYSYPINMMLGRVIVM
jgi:hypothetical protein